MMEVRKGSQSSPRLFLDHSDTLKCFAATARGWLWNSRLENVSCNACDRPHSFAIHDTTMAGIVWCLGECFVLFVNDFGPCVIIEMLTCTLL